MKRKIVKIKPGKTIDDRVSGIALFRVTGPHPETKERVVKEFYGTRKEAENYEYWREK